MPHANKNEKKFFKDLGSMKFVTEKDGFVVFAQPECFTEADIKKMNAMPPADSLSYRLIGKKLPFKK